MQECKMKSEEGEVISTDRNQQNKQPDITADSWDLSERLLEFAVRVGKVVDALPRTRLGRHVATQLVQSGTSPDRQERTAAVKENVRP
jgi:hypothetical protein